MNTSCWRHCFTQSEDFTHSLSQRQYNWPIPAKNHKLTGNVVGLCSNTSTLTIPSTICLFLLLGLSCVLSDQTNLQHHVCNVNYACSGKRWLVYVLPCYAVLSTTSNLHWLHLGVGDVDKIRCHTVEYVILYCIINILYIVIIVNFQGY